MGTIVTEANQGGGLLGRQTIELKKAFFKEVKSELKRLGYNQEADNLQYKDLINLSGGTSFGGLETIGSSRIDGRQPYFSSPSEFGDYIDENANTIFPHHKGFFGKLFNDPRQILSGVAGTPQFSNKPLRGMIQDIVGKDTHMSDVEDDIMITMTRVHPTLDAMFAKSHVARGEVTALDKGDEAQQKDWILWEAALGSASPTTFFPGVELHNNTREKPTVVVDGGQSGWNNPSIPVLTEATFIYGKESEDPSNCFVMDSRAHKGYTMPHDIIHIHWGTGDFNDGVSYKDAKKNTLISMKDVIVATSMQSVHRFSVRSGQQSLKNYFNFDIPMDEIPEEIRPDDDFTLASKDQMYKLAQAGIYAAEKLSSQIKEAAQLVTNAYIERIEYERQNTAQTYKDFLKSDVCEIG